MKNTLLGKEPLGNRYWQVRVQLIPENEQETNALQNTENTTASEEERELITNYLLFNLSISGLSLVDNLGQKNNIFLLKMFQE